jgi:GTPase Era involved in 16S rRNA processing
MLEKAVSTIHDADLALVVADPLETPEKLRSVMDHVSQAGREAILVLNKADLIGRETALHKLRELGAGHRFVHSCAVSSTTGDGIDPLLDEIKARLPEDPAISPKT